MPQKQLRVSGIAPYISRVPPEDPGRKWTVLECAIDRIYSNNCSSLSFEELYRTVYTLCLSKYSEFLAQHLERTISERVGKVAEKLANTHEGFLEALSKEWVHHKQSMSVIRDIFMFLDRSYYFKNSPATGVFDMGLVQFYEHVLKSKQVLQRFQTTVLAEIKRERNGDRIDHYALRNAISILVDLGLDVYEQNFEERFLSDSAEFYALEAQRYIVSSSCSDYLLKADQRMLEEITRVKLYLHESTKVPCWVHSLLADVEPSAKALLKRLEPRIVDEVCRKFVAAHMSDLFAMDSGLDFFLEHDRVEDVQRMYRLFLVLDDVEQRDALVRHISSYFIRAGNVLRSDEALTAVGMVEKIIALHDKFSLFLRDALSSSRPFSEARVRSFESFMKGAQVAEFLATFADERLRRGFRTVEDSEVDRVLSVLVSLFKYLDEKDVFHSFYRQKLAKRLLTGRLVSEDIERLMIQKLKFQCGSEVTSKLEKMLRDIQTSADLNRQYNTRHPTASPVSLNVSVLTTGCWPFAGTPEAVLPADIGELVGDFTSFYVGSMRGRKLMWLFDKGSADVVAHFDKSSHTLNVSTHQMLVLGLFNGHDSLTLREIMTGTNIPRDGLESALLSLSAGNYRILKKRPRGTGIDETTRFEFNRDFTHRLHRIRIPPILQIKEAAFDAVVSHREVQGDRQHSVDAAIVRIMKSRRTLMHAALVTETIAQLQSRFAPHPKFIKERIEHLIEKDFLARSDESPDIYHYVA